MLGLVDDIVLEISVVSKIFFSFPSCGITYSQVYVRVVAYQYATPDAIQHGQLKTLRNILVVSIPNITISTYSACVDGISLIHGYPHQRVWTFMAGYFEYVQQLFTIVYAQRTTQTVQSFIGSDYCESWNPNNN